MASREMYQPESSCVTNQAATSDKVNTNTDGNRKMMPGIPREEKTQQKASKKKL